MSYNGECIHGVPIFDKNGNLNQCPKCRSNALAAINQESLNKFMTPAEQKAYGLDKSETIYD